MKTFAAKLHKGFTLVEIMIVVAIIALLAAMLFRGFSARASGPKPAASSTICE